MKARRLVSVLGTLTLAVLLPPAAYVGWLAQSGPPHMSFPVRLPSIVTADGELGFTLKPNLDVPYPLGANRSFAIYTSEQGLRVAGKGTGPFGAVEIVVAGDSQTFGDGLEYAQTYSAKLAKAFGVTVANLGVSGYGTVSSLLRLKRFGFLKPRVVVLGHYYDHHNRNLSKCYPGFSITCISVPHVAFADDGKAMIQGPKGNTTAIREVAGYFDYAQGLSGGYSFLKDAYWVGRVKLGELLRGLHLADRYEQDFDPGLVVAATEFVMRELLNATKEIGARLFVLYIPDYFGDRVVPPPDYLVRIAAELGIDFVDMTLAFQRQKEEEPGSLQIVEAGGHLTELGHELMARELAARIRQAGLL